MTDTIERQINHIRNGQIPTGYRWTNAGIIPSTWEAKPLSSIVEEITETPGSSKIETVSISAGIGFVNQAKKFGKELSGKQYEKYIVLHRGDFSYNKGNSSAYPQGCIYRLTDREQAAVPNVFESFRICKGNADYYEQLFISGFLNQQLYSKINRGVRDNGLLNLTGEEFYSCEVPFPPLEEQQKIAKILMHCDQIISLYQEQIHEIKKQKDYFLHNMFPRQGENIPEIRFKNHTGPWEQRKLKELYTKAGSGGTPSSQNDSYYNGNIPFLGISDIKGRCIYSTAKTITESGLDNSSAWLVPKGAICLAMYASVGKLGILTQDAATSQAFFNMVFEEECLRDFIYTRLEKADIFQEWEPFISTGTQRNLNAEKVANFTISVPSCEETAGIASFFRSLDDLITLHQQKLDAMQRMKKSLMQLLLTGIVRVNT